MSFFKKDALKQLDIAIKKYNLKTHDLIMVNVSSDDVPQDMMINIHNQVSKSIEEIGVSNISILIMADPMEMFRLDASDMAALGWFRLEESFFDRLNDAGVINYSERLTLMGMFKKLESMRPQDTKQLLDRKMKTIKGNNKKRKRG